MLKVRHGAPFAASMMATGFCLGITIGHVRLGFVTPRFGKRWSVAAYLVFGVALQLLFWLVPNFIVSAVAVALLGYFLGPLFLAAVIVIAKLLPKQQHVGAIGLRAAVGAAM